MATELEKYKKRIATTGGAATLAAHGKEHYKKMRAAATDKSYFRGVQDGLMIGSMNARTPDTLLDLQLFIQKALQQKQYDKLNEHKIIGQFK